MTRLYKPDYLERALWSILDTLLPIPLRYANQQAEQLTPPYAVLDVGSRMSQGRDTVFDTLDDGTQIYHGTRHGSITLTIVGDLCCETADDLVNIMQTPDASTLYRNSGPVLYNARPVMNGPITLERNQVEQACVVDMQFRTNVIHAQVGELIEYVVVKYDVFDPAKKLISHDAIVAALDGGQLPADKVFAVIIDKPPPEQLKVGNTIPEPVRWKPASMHIKSADLQYDLARMRADVVNGRSVWTFLMSGPLAVTYTVTNTDNTVASETAVLQITA